MPQDFTHQYVKSMLIKPLTMYGHFSILLCLMPDIILLVNVERLIVSESAKYHLIKLTLSMTDEPFNILLHLTSDDLTR